MYQDDKQFFLGLSEKPEWLTQTEWKVLQRYYDRTTPCEPSVNALLNAIATQLVGGRIKTNTQGWNAANASLQSGREKLRHQMSQQIPETPEQSQVSAHIAPATTEPWWSRY